MDKLKVYVAADHGGFKLKESIKSWLKDREHEVEDCGAEKFIETDDYPDYVESVVKKVRKDDGNAFGLLFCKSGAGMAITANKFRGIRAVDLRDTQGARMARIHNNANIVSIGAEWVGGNQAKNIMKVFLNVKYKGEERHERRIKKISKIENKTMKK